MSGKVISFDDRYIRKMIMEDFKESFNEKQIDHIKKHVNEITRLAKITPYSNNYLDIMTAINRCYLEAYVLGCTRKI